MMFDKSRVSRRGLLRGAGAAGTVIAIQGPFTRAARAAPSLKVSTFGGYFERSFAAFVYPAFTRATGIAVQSIEQPEGAQFLFQLAEANKAGAPPMDICCVSPVDVRRGRDLGLWHGFAAARMPNLAQLPPRFVMSGADASSPDAIGAMSWYMTLVVDPDALTPLPDSWTVLWDRHPNAFGVESGSMSVILEIAAATWFGGNAVLMSKDGIDKVIAKIGEMKPNVKLWWQDEGTMQTALINQEIAGGTYMHDTAMVMIRNGTPVRSIFPREGAVESTNYWCQPSASTKIEEAEAFVNFCCTPEAQQLIARHVGSAPVMERSRLDLTDQEFAAVAPDSPAILAADEARFRFGDYMEREFTRMVTS